MARPSRQRKGWLEKMKVIARMKRKFSKEHHKRLRDGVDWVVIYWQRDDGNAGEFAKFCEDNFVADQAELERMLAKFAECSEQIFGSALDLYRRLHRPLHLDTGPITKWDKLFARIDPFSAMHRTFFDSKVAFVALLNFGVLLTEQLFAVEDMLTLRQWTEARLTDSMRSRMPPLLERRIDNAYLDAEEYISDYNIFSSCLVDLDGNPLFSEQKKLLSHWGLRDELRAQYFQPNGFEKQHALYEVMKKIILQKVPDAVVNNDGILWDPTRNKVFDTETNTWTDVNPEPNTRYRHLRRIFLAEKLADRHYSNDFIYRSFSDSAEIPEKIVEELLVSILSSPLAKQVAKVVKGQLGRRLMPFDIWYKHFVRYDEKALDPVVKHRYPDPQTFHEDMPRILRKMGFSRKISKLIADNVQVDACRGSGHAWGALRREDKVLLRTRFEKDGLAFQGFDIGLHELGHCAEMVMCQHLAQNSILAGLPNIGFSEAFAFLFERQRLEILGIRSSRKDKYFLILDTFWDGFEICGVALLDIHIWRWMYRHKDASPEEINIATRALAKNIWKKYFAPVFGIDDDYILAIYSHIIGYGLYMPNYAIGQIATFQVLDFCRRKHWPTEMERMCKIGSISPNTWLKQAVGSPLSLEPMFRLVKEALKKVR